MICLQSLFYRAFLIGVLLLVRLVALTPSSMPHTYTAEVFHFSFVSLKYFRFYDKCPLRIVPRYVNLINAVDLFWNALSFVKENLLQWFVTFCHQKTTSGTIDQSQLTLGMPHGLCMQFFSNLFAIETLYLNYERSSPLEHEPLYTKKYSFSTFQSP